MDVEKRPRSMSPLRPGAVRRNRPLLALLLVAIGLYTCFQFPSVAQLATTPLRSGEAAQGVRAKVPLEAHIMSKCPDARVRAFLDGRGWLADVGVCLTDTGAGLP